MARHRDCFPREFASQKSAVMALVTRLGAVFLFLALPLAGTAAETPPPEGATEISLDEALKLLEGRDIPEEISAKAGYIVRRYQRKDPADLDRTIKSVKQALEQAREIRIKNDRKFGIDPDIEALKEADERTLKEMAEKLRERHQQDTETYAARFYQQGQKWREERMPLSNDASLPELVKLVQEEGFRPNFVQCWNGKQTAALKRPLDKQKQPFAKEHLEHGYAVLSDEKQEPPAVFSRPQPILTDEIIARFKKAGYTIDVYRLAGQQNDLLIELRMSAINSLDMPAGSQGAANLSVIRTTSSVMRFREAFNFSLIESTLKTNELKTNETVVQSERNTDYVRTESGRHTPKSLVLETRSPDSGKVQFRIEHLAFEQPETNVAFEPSLFDLAQTKEFQSLPLDNLSEPNAPKPTQQANGAD